LNQYKLYLEASIDELLSQQYANCDLLYEGLIQCICCAAETTLPSCSYNPYTKPYWNDDVKEAHNLAREKRRIWLLHGKPRGMHFQTYSEYKEAKRQFRKTQKIASDKYIENTYRDLDEMAECDIRMFWKALKRFKRNKKSTFQEIIVNGKTLTETNDICSAFSTYFEDIYMAKDDAEFDKDHSKVVSGWLQQVIRTDTYFGPNAIGTTIKAEDVTKAIKGLKRRKAPGWDTVQNEHLIYGGSKLISAITTLFNTVLRNEKIPTGWKRGLLIPIYKGNGKSKHDTDSYRPVTLLPTLYKLFEKIVDDRLRSFLSENLVCKQQQGFQRNVSCVTTTFNLQETIYHNVELNNKVYVAFLDTKKAFDTVWHNGLLKIIHDKGITGKIWRIIMEAYSDMTSEIVINEHSSQRFQLRQGVRQGGVLSSLLYILYIDGLLNKLEESCSGAKAFSLQCGNPTLADDITCIALTPYDLQNMLNVAYAYSKKWKFRFSVEKSCVLVVNNKQKDSKVQFYLGKHPIPENNSHLHLGILQDKQLNLNERIKRACSKGRKAFFSLHTYGVKPIGLNPLTSASLYRKIVIPTALYGCELWGKLNKTNIAMISRLQHFIAKKTQGFPQATRSIMCESMLGLPPLITEVERRKLLFLQKLISMPNNVLSKQIFNRRLLLYDIDPTQVNHGFIPDIHNIIRKYHLEDFVDSYKNSGLFPNKYHWKNITRDAILHKQQTTWQNSVKNDSDFKRFKEIHNGIKPASVWRIPVTSYDMKLADYVARLWVTVPDENHHICCQCECRYTDLARHIVSECSVNLKLRDRFMDSITDTFQISLSVELHNADSEQFIQLLMGKETVTNLEDDKERLFRMMCFQLIKSSANDYYSEHLN